MLDHGDDIREGFVVNKLMGLLEFLFRKVVSGKFLPQLVQDLCLPFFGSFQKDLDGLDMLRILPDEARKGIEIILRLLIVACSEIITSEDTSSSTS